MPAGVLTGQEQLDVAIHRNVQRVDLTLATWILGLPHPMLGDDIGGQRIAARAGGANERVGTENPWPLPWP
jgi:hypothetical protein